MSSETPKPCWDTGATLSKNKAAKRIKTSTSWTPSPWKAPHAMLHWENRKAAAPSDTYSKPAWEKLGRPTGEHQASHGFPPATPGINQHIPLSRLPPNKKTWTINKELETKTQQRGRVAESAPEKGGGARSWSFQELSVNKGWKGRRANNGPVINHSLK
jgi:hypothetical protein